jgi:hypothetical protein
VQLTKCVKVALIGMALTVAGSAGAQEIHFAGTTSGCFYQGTVCVPAATPVTIGGLTYGSGPGNQFDNYTDEDGYLAIGDAYENFGIFSLNNTNFDYNGWKFVLKVMFSAPPGVNSVTPASLIGQVKNGTGGVTIDFDNAIQSFTADDGTHFNFQVADLDVTRGGVGYVNGAVTVTPEPATVALMMTGIAGLVPMVRGRRKPRNEE